MKNLTTNNNTVYSILNNNKYSIQYKQYSNDELKTIINNLSDVIKNDKFEGFYVNKLKELGTTRFCELANKARQSSDTPEKLFCWMLKNNTLVK